MIKNCDSLEYVKTIQDNSLDMILTDPPYNTTDLKIDKMGFNLEDYLQDFKRILKPNGWFFCFGTVEIAVSILSNGWRRKFQYVWVKPKPTQQFYNVVKPLASHELLFAFIITPKVMNDLYFNKMALRSAGSAYERKNKNRTSEFSKSHDMYKGFMHKNDGYREGVDVIYFSNKTTMDKAERTPHPTQKPLKLIELLLRGYCPPNGKVFDPFAGSGTTAVAAYNTGRHCIACEINPDYFKIMSDRVKTAQKNPRLEIF